MTATDPSRNPSATTEPDDPSLDIALAADLAALATYGVHKITAECCFAGLAGWIENLRLFDAAGHSIPVPDTAIEAAAGDPRPEDFEDALHRWRFHTLSLASPGFVTRQRPDGYVDVVLPECRTQITHTTMPLTPTPDPTVTDRKGERHVRRA